MVGTRKIRNKEKWLCLKYKSCREALEVLYVMLALIRKEVSLVNLLKILSGSLCFLLKDLLLDRSFG